MGDLVQKTEAELLRLPNTGRKTVHEIQQTLAKFGLRLGMPLPEWGEVDATAIRSEAHAEIRCAVRQLELGIGEPTATTLQEELRNALSKVSKERNLELILSLWGLDGTERKTLEQVGRAYSMTRERVRQIEATTVRKLRARWHELPLLDAALQVLERSGPVEATDVSALLCFNDVQSSKVSGYALLKAREVFERSANLTVSSLSPSAIIGSPEQVRMLGRAKREMRRTTQSFGCTSLNRIQFQLSGNIEGAGNLRRGLELLSEVVWLDSEHNWLFSKVPVRNRLHNLIEKIFTVTPHIHLTELRQAVSRPHRMKFVPPAEVLASYCVHLGFKRTAQNEIVSEHLFESELGELDGAFVRGFRKNGSPLTREELEDYCVEEEGMKVSSFYQRLSYCPLFLRLSHGVYGLVGAHIPPGSVEVAKKRILEQRVSPQFGWTSNGRLWVVLRLSRSSVHSGAFFVPTFVNDHAEGLWALALPDGTMLGTVEVKQSIANGLRDAFELLAADAGDFCLLMFDLKDKTASVQVGGPDLEDQATRQNSLADDDDEEGTEEFSDPDVDIA